MCTQELSFIEFFAGEGEVWRTVRADAPSSIGLDISYVDPEGRQNPMDSNSPAGLASIPQDECMRERLNLSPLKMSIILYKCDLYLYCTYM